jgi:sulfur-oxidizing protein SoxA
MRAARPVCFGILVLLALALSAAPAREEEPVFTAGEKRSGSTFLSPALKAQQDDDGANPGMLWVAEGEKLWGAATGSSGKSCASCHGDAAASMKGVAAGYPAIDAASGQLMNLELRINQCRSQRQGAPALAWESSELLALASYVAFQSRGLPIKVAIYGPARPHFEAGREFFMTRQGQLNLACSQCHDDNWGKSLAGNKIPQAHPTGYPIYRLEWQSVGSLQRRLRNCMIGMRAEPYAYGAAEHVDMELYLMWRARGMKVETPAVRP